MTSSNFRSIVCTDKDLLDPELWQFDQEALQKYILGCCQSAHGGLIDKPGKSKDFYHTCYCLSGLSASQHCFGSKRVINISGDEAAILVSSQWIVSILHYKRAESHSSSVQRHNG